MSNPQSILLVTKTFDKPDVNSDTLVIEPDPSIGIEAIRNIKQFVVYPPLTHPTKQVFIIEADKLTIEAQNAFLKTLEEPPAYVQITLVTTKPHQLLDTITSRCIRIDQYSPPIISEIPPISLLSLISLSPPKRLSALPQTKSKDIGLSLAFSLMNQSKDMVYQEPNPSTVHNFKLLSECYQHLVANANPTLALSDAVLQLSLPS